MPTRKWFAATVTAAGGLLVMLLTGDRQHVTDPEIIALVTFGVQRFVAWMTSNEPKSV